MNPTNQNVTNSIMEEYKEYLTDLNKEEKAYITHRLIKQIIWYDQTAINKQQKYKTFTILSIILTALIPCLSVLTVYKYGVAISMLIAVLGATSSSLSAIINLCEFQKLWIEYRANCEMLKSILHRYFTHSGEFNKLPKEEAFHTLITLSEDYLIKEFRTWTTLSHAPKEDSTK